MGEGIVNKRSILRTGVMQFFIHFCVIFQVKAQLGEPPNLILIIADDMAWNDCGACGHPNVRTPNIDKLAEDGMMFNQAFLTTSSCSPSRASIITGTYPHQTDAEQLHWEILNGPLNLLVSHYKVSLIFRLTLHLKGVGQWILRNCFRYTVSITL